jgi:hypothetical protein
VLNEQQAGLAIIMEGDTMTSIEENISCSPTGKTGSDDRARDIQNRHIEQARQNHQWSNAISKILTRS